MKKILRIVILSVILILALSFWWRYYFVFGEGVKAGSLNFFVKKGYVFKTYEGRLIQDGFKSATPGALQSNEFEFSVTSDSIASILERNSGKNVELKYKEYLHTLPWRGNSNYVVIEVLKAEYGTKKSNLPYQ
ncbi:MAG: hypothetical protein Q8S54_14020 [Bacteroidota bacterium]|nr:hypothetical protein [Odoribacter sp.]MDP3644293.1 hypothetical protein [Bacteroidota bacterium]